MRKVWVKNVPIGGNAPISIQSMTKVPTSDIGKIIRQIKELEEAGCQIVRAAIPDLKSAEAISAIKKEIKIPLVADIHFNYRLALVAMEHGADKIRLNPGNIYRTEEIETVVREAKRRKIPIRIGVNSGSLGDCPRFTARREGGGRIGTVPFLSQQMVNFALSYIRLFEKLKFKDIIISLKTPDVFSTIESYKLMAKKVDYPFHLGMTATGPLVPALIKSSIGIGILLMEGIGDTIRVSLTGEPADEVKAGQGILKALGLRKGIEIISCPTCGRCRVNLVKIVRDFEKSLNCSGRIYATNSIHRTCSGRVYSALLSSLKVAIMGCEVNGPGEAKEADIGIAFSGKNALLFKKGKPIKKIKEQDTVQVLLNEIRKNLTSN